MPYTRPYAAGFIDYPNTTTPLTASALNTMDLGIKGAYDQIQTLTTTQRNAISSPSLGQLVWDSDLEELFVYLNGSAGNAWFGLGNYIICTLATRPATPVIGMLIYQTDTDEILKYVTDVDGTVRWMQMNDNPRRNLVINGSFDVWQRGTSFNPASASTLSNANYGADRWQMVQATTSAAAFTQQANTSSGPAGYNFYTRVQRVAAATLVTPYLLFTSFESRNLRSVRGKYVTLSFWARAGANYSAASSGLSVQVAGGVGTDNTYDNFSTPFGVASSTFTLTTGWKRFTLTSAATLSTTTSQLGIRIAFTPVGTAGADDYFDITGVQLEVGTAPTDFEFRDVGEELARCQRYYQRFVASTAYGRFAVGQSFSGTGHFWLLHFPTTMRTAPVSIDTTGLVASNFAITTNIGGTQALNTLPVLAATANTPNSAYIEGTTAAGGTTGAATMLIANNLATAFLGFSAEL